MNEKSIFYLALSLLFLVSCDNNLDVTIPIDPVSSTTSSSFSSTSSKGEDTWKEDTLTLMHSLLKNHSLPYMEDFKNYDYPSSSLSNNDFSLTIKETLPFSFLESYEDILHQEGYQNPIGEYSSYTGIYYAQKEFTDATIIIQMALVNDEKLPITEGKGYFALRASLKSDDL